MLLRNKPSKPSTRASRQSGKEETTAGTRWVRLIEVQQHQRAFRSRRPKVTATGCRFSLKRTFYSKAFLESSVISSQNEKNKSVPWTVGKQVKPALIRAEFLIGFLMLFGVFQVRSYPFLFFKKKKQNKTISSEFFLNFLSGKNPLILTIIWHIRLKVQLRNII